MTWHLFSAKASLEPMLWTIQLALKEQIWNLHQNMLLNSKKCIWKAVYQMSAIFFRSYCVTNSIWFFQFGTDSEHKKQKFPMDGKPVDVVSMESTKEGRNDAHIWQVPPQLGCGYTWHFDGLTHWGRDKMAAIFQTTFSNRFSWMKMYELWLKFQWNLFRGVQLTIFQHWFR